MFENILFFFLYPGLMKFCFSVIFIHLKKTTHLLLFKLNRNTFNGDICPQIGSVRSLHFIRIQSENNNHVAFQEDNI